MKKINKKIYLQYSEESIKRKEHLLRFFLILLNSVFIFQIASSIINGFFTIENNTLKFLICTCISILISIPFSRIHIDSPLFLDDKVIINSKTKVNGEKEDKQISKFTIIIFINIIVSIPLLLIFSLTITSLANIILNLIIKNNAINKIIYYIILTTIFKTLFKNVNKFIIEYIREK